MTDLAKEEAALDKYRQKIMDRAVNDKVLYMAVQYWMRGEMSWGLAMTMAALALSEQYEKAFQLAVDALSIRPVFCSISDTEEDTLP